MEQLQIDVRAARLIYPIADDVKRLCLKMSVAAAARSVGRFPISEAARRYLIHADSGDVCPVRIAVDQYAELDALRPRAGHLVYVRANPMNRRVFSIVQIFGAMQYYCDLGVVDGPEVSVVGVHDPVSHREQFQTIAPLDLPVPARDIPTDEYRSAMGKRLEVLRRELVDMYGDQAPLTLTINA